MNGQIEINNIEYKNYNFKYVKWFGYEILINKEDEYINITKLLKQINPNKRFKDIEKQDYYIEYRGFLNGFLNGDKNPISNFAYKIRGNQYSQISGTYIHPKLLNCVLMHVDMKYAFYVSEIMEQLNNNNLNQVNKLVEELKTTNEQLQTENQKLHNQIENNKPKIIPVQTNELETNVKIKIYEDKTNEEKPIYKISYDQNKNLETSTNKLYAEFLTNSASNIVKSKGLKQFYVDKKTRIFNSDNLNDVINYLKNSINSTN